MKRLFVVLVMGISFYSGYAQKLEMDGFVRLCDLKIPPKADSKDNKLSLDEVYCLEDSLLVVSGHRKVFNYFFVYELRTFQLVYDTSLNKIDKYNGILSYTTADTAMNVLYVVKDYLFNTYWKIDLEKQTLVAIHCDSTPNSCKKLEATKLQKISRSKNGNFMYQIVEDKGKSRVVVWLAQEEFQKKRDEFKKARKDAGIVGSDSTVILTKNYFLLGGR